MFYSDRLKLLFVACPKTGSTSVEAILLQLDSEGERFRISLPDRTIDSTMVATDSLGHATALEFRQVLGDEHYRNMRVIGFVRDPIEKLVSTYYFTKKGRLLSVFDLKTPKSKLLLAVKRVMTILAARLMPFSVWALFFPMKTCSSYFVDASDRIIVDYLGATHRLNTDLVEMLNDIGIDMSQFDVPRLNTSVHKQPDDYVRKGSFLHKVLSRRYKNDARLFKLVESGYFKSEKRALLTATIDP